MSASEFYQANNGIFFQRLEAPSGMVRMTRTRNGHPPDKDNIDWDFTFTDGEWASLVCQVSDDGETFERWADFLRNFHYHTP